MTEGSAPRHCGGDSAEPPALPDQHAVYLFAFADRARIERLPDGSDLPPPRPFVHAAGTIAAVVATVPIADYSGPFGERNLADLAWLAPRVRDHDLVCRRVMAGSPLFPAPFGTLYQSFASLTAFTMRHEASIAAFLRAVAGTEEWGLTATAEPASRETLEATARLAWPDWQSLSPGTRYLRLCRERPALAEAARARARQLVAALVDELRPLAVRLRAFAGAAPGDRTAAESIARYAFLVRSGDVPVLTGRVAELRLQAAQQQVGLTLSGPWPPFSFRPSLQR